MKTVKKKNWDELSHQQKIDILKTSGDSEIAAAYRPKERTPEEFSREITDWRLLYSPGDIGTVEEEGDAPTKETLLGAIRDLDRTEALLELIDNSIDAWKRRRDAYPNATAPTLQIYVEIDRRLGTLRYEDNAGGIARDRIVNLVIPGHSETGDLSRTIGSYKTGGKKAIFKLAREAKLESYYWSPVGTSDEAYAIHLDSEWLEDQTRYKFPLYPIINRTNLLKGQTVYTIKLRENEDWGPDAVGSIRSAIQRTYTLLLARNPEIQIHFLNRKDPLEPLADLYRFTSAKTATADLRPQRVVFETELAWRGYTHPLEIEVVIGCRTTTATKRDEDVWGLDLYGNDRLFKLHDQDDVLGWFPLPTGNARQLLRGFINIKGPNVFVPWDTHKRHLNADREIVRVLREHPMIQQLFTEWGKVYKNVGNNAEEIKALVKDPAPSFKLGSDKSPRDVFVAFDSKVALNKTKRGSRLPDSVHKPLFPTGRTANRTGSGPEVRFTMTTEEYRRVREAFGMPPMNDDPGARKQLAQEVKGYILLQIERGRTLS